MSASLPPPSIGGVPGLALQLAGLGGFAPWQLASTRNNSMANGARDTTDTANLGRLVKISHVACGNLSVVRAAYSNIYNGTNGETPNTNAIAVIAGIEYPAGQVYPLTFRGRSVGHIDGGAVLVSDPIAVSIPAGAVFYERALATTSLPPSNMVATAGAGGSLAAATYFYKVTAVTDLGESGVSAEVSATPAASGTVKLTWTDNNQLIPTRYFNVYRSTATGTEKLMTSVPPGGQCTFIDTGAIAPGATNPPATGLYVPRGTPLSQTYNVEGQIFSSPAPQTQLVASAPGFGSVNSPCFSACAIYGLGTGIPAAVALIGDSIMTGTGDTNYTGRGAGDSGFAVRALDAVNIPHVSMAQGGETLANFQGPQRQNRLARLAGVKHAISNYGTNSLATVSVANLKAAILEIAAAVIATGAKVEWCTLNPKTTSTDNWTTAANQTPINGADAVDGVYNTPELRRQQVNNWLRDTSAAGFVAQAGGTSVAAVFDTAATVEVNAANALTLNGGRYVCAAAQNVAQYGTTDGTHPTTAAHQLMQAAIVTASLG